MITIHRVLERPDPPETNSFYLTKDVSGVALAVTGNTPDVVVLKRIPTVKGPTVLVKGVEASFTITNWSAADPWEVTANGAEVSQDQASFTLFVDESEPFTQVFFTIAGREFALEAVAPVPATPAITSPIGGGYVAPEYAFADGTVGLPVFAASPFQMPAGVDDAALAGNWELSETGDFSTLVASKELDGDENSAEWRLNLPVTG